MPLIYHNNKPLFVNNKIAFDKACCCNNCSRACIVVRLGWSAISVTGSQPWEPVGAGTSPPGPTLSSMESTMKWHAHSYDTISTNAPRTGYHTHVWLMEVKFNAFEQATGVPALLPLDRYVAELEAWKNSLLQSITGDEYVWQLTPTTEIIGGNECLTTFYAEEWARPPLEMSGVANLSGIPYWEGADLFGPDFDTSYPDCTAYQP